MKSYGIFANGLNSFQKLGHDRAIIEYTLKVDFDLLRTQQLLKMKLGSEYDLRRYPRNLKYKQIYWTNETFVLISQSKIIYFVQLSENG